jgi:hypothetical protein
MAVFETLHNGKVKRVNGRFGGEKRRRQGEEQDGIKHKLDRAELISRRTRIDSLSLLREASDLDLALADLSSGAEHCSLTGERKPVNGTVSHTTVDGTEIKVVYEGGKPRCAHCLPARRGSNR